MADAAFNTIAEVQRLRDAGFEQKQAEAITLSIHSGVTGGVATKADLDLLKADIDLLKTDIELFKTDLEKKIEVQGLALEKKIDKQGGELRTEIATVRGEIATAKFDLTWRLLGGIAVLNGLLFAIMRYLPPPG